jgi:hypothetical protein
MVATNLARICKYVVTTMSICGLLVVIKYVTPHQHSMFIHKFVAEQCDTKPEPCIVDLSEFRSVYWTRVAFVRSPMGDPKIGLNIDRYPVNYGQSAILLIDGNQVVAVDVLELEPETNPKHIFIDFNDLSKNGWVEYNRNDAHFIAERWGPAHESWGRVPIVLHYNSINNSPENPTP